MSDIQFHETRRGQTFCERDIPKLVAALHDIAAELKLLNHRLTEEEARDDEQT